jgi:hypothetical protein
VSPLTLTKQLLFRYLDRSIDGAVSPRACPKFEGMTKIRDFLRGLAATSVPNPTASHARANHQRSTGSEDRTYWLNVMVRLATPVLDHLAQQRLKERMPVECVTGSAAERGNYSHLEALGRLLAGISPWLELDLKSTEEDHLRNKYADLARRALDSATNPQSPDFMNFTRGQQPLVDAAFLAHAIIRAPNELWKELAPETRANVIAALKSTRVIKPVFNNWLLFSAMIEAALCSVGEEWDAVRVDYAVRQHEQWYKGDGIYGDGPDFHWDYYNSFVIQPMLIDVLRTVSKVSRGWEEFYKDVMTRARRYAEILERMISPEGTFPAIGRSLAYRFGAFQLLGQIALMRQLPRTVTPAQVRCVLTAVIHRMIEAPGTFDADGWLTIGFSGHQPNIAEPYISTGSVYLCSVGLLPLGLPPDDEFWKAEQEDWSSKKAWTGQNLDADHAI